MNIKETKNDGLMIQVEMDFNKEDYAEKVKKALNKFRREVDIKGFRKGMAPMSLVEKFHGQQALVESINGLITENLDNYIKQNNLSLIGEPLPNEEKESQNDWVNGENFQFTFDMALAPKVDVTLTKEDKIPYYTISATEKELSEYKSNILKQYGKLETCDTVKEEDYMIADFVQGEKQVLDTYVWMKNIADKNLFLGKKAGDTMQINVVEVFPNETDRAAMLKVKKEELAGMESMWQFTIKEVKNYVDAVLGEELYNQLFGEGNVKTEEEFEAKLKERMENESKQESDYRFMLDTREYLLAKTDIKLAEDFMKRWLFAANDGKFTMEEIDKDFSLFMKDFRWQTIAQFIMKQQNLQVTKELVMEQARRFASYQFAMYGINNVPQEHLDKYAENLLQNEKEGRRIYEKAEEEVVLEYVRKTVTVEPKSISTEELRKMNEQ